MKKFSKLTDKINRFYKKAQEASSAGDIVNLQDSLRQMLNVTRNMPGVSENYLREGYNLSIERPEDNLLFAKKVKQFSSNLNQQVSLNLPSKGDEYRKYHEALMLLNSNIDMVLNPVVKRNKPVPEFLEKIKSVLDRVSSLVETASKKPMQEKTRIINESKSMLGSMQNLVLRASMAYSSSYPKDMSGNLVRLEKMLADFSILMNLKLGAEYLKTLKPSVDKLINQVNSGKTIKPVEEATSEQVREFGNQKSYM